MQMIPSHHEETNAGGSTNANDIGDILAGGILESDKNEKNTHHNAHHPNNGQIFLCDLHDCISKERMIESHPCRDIISSSFDNFSSQQ
jgi:hypothetical protein